MPLLPHRLERLHSGRIEIGHVDDLVIGASETCSTRSYGLQLVYYVMAAGLELREVPIAFADRTKGKSKMPKLQILHGTADLVRLVAQKYGRSDRSLAPDICTDEPCSACGNRVLAMHGERRDAGVTFKCLHCHSVQTSVPAVELDAAS
jgi:hypothetical protein